MTPLFFATQDEFRKWLEANHRKGQYLDLILVLVMQKQTII
jgi:hypothetical protein